MPRKFDAREVLNAIAIPRLVGSEGWHRVRREIRERFERLGYETETFPFLISPVPGRFALTVAGSAFVLGALLCSAFLLAGRPHEALAAITFAAVAILLVALLVAPVSERMRWRQLRARNLLFKRAPHPRWVLMAHYDSKSQLMPLLVRGPAGFLAGMAWLVLFGQAVLAHLAPPPAAGPVIAGIVGMVSGAVFIFSWAADRSPGALDNASGVATLLGVAARDEGADVAYLVTDAEELGLLGARAAVRALPPVEGVINIDGIDDGGEFRVFERFGLPRHGYAYNLRAALLTAAGDRETRLTPRDVPVGILLDHMPFSRAGFPALTLLRGSLRSLARVHRPADHISRLRGAGVDDAVGLLCRALEILRNTDRAGVASSGGLD